VIVALFHHLVLDELVDEVLRDLTFLEQALVLTGESVIDSVFLWVFAGDLHDYSFNLKMESLYRLV
jgi:hypothetical protein